MSPGLAARLSPSIVNFLESPRLHSPDVAFGLPGILMAIATLVFWLGRKKFVHIPPTGMKNYVREIFNPTLKTSASPHSRPFIMILGARANFPPDLQADRWMAFLGNYGFVPIQKVIRSHPIIPAFFLTWLSSRGQGVTLNRSADWCRYCAGAIFLVAYQTRLDGGLKPNIICSWALVI